jgi:hypothetical protein
VTPFATHGPTVPLTRPVARLLAGTLTIGLVAAVLAYRWRGPDDVLPGAPAALLCLLPATLTLCWAARAGLRGDPSAMMVAFLGGMLARLGVALGGGLACYFLVPALQRPAFWAWVALFYLVTLGLETSLALRLMRGGDGPGQGPPS